MIKLIQQSVLFCELNILKSKNQLSGRFSNLSPFIDSEGILRVGRRIDKSNLAFSLKHPALLQQGHQFVEVLIREEHYKIMHGGTQATLNALQQNFWIVNGRNAVKEFIHKCVNCARAKPTSPQYVVGDLSKGGLSLERSKGAGYVDAKIYYFGSTVFVRSEFRPWTKFLLYFYNI